MERKFYYKEGENNEYEYLNIKRAAYAIIKSAEVVNARLSNRKTSLFKMLVVNRCHLNSLLIHVDRDRLLNRRKYIDDMLERMKSSGVQKYVRDVWNEESEFVDFLIDNKMYECKTEKTFMDKFIKLIPNK